MRTSAEIRSQIESLDPTPRAIRSRIIAGRGELQRRESLVLQALTDYPVVDPDHVGNQLASIWNNSQLPIVTDVLKLRASLAMLETCEHADFITKTLDPLHAELEEAEKAEADALTAIGDAERVAHEARAAARTKAEDNLAKDKGVKDAEAALAALKEQYGYLLPESPPPTLDRQTIYHEGEAAAKAKAEEALAGDFH